MAIVLFLLGLIAFGLLGQPVSAGLGLVILLGFAYGVLEAFWYLQSRAQRKQAPAPTANNHETRHRDA